MIHGFFEYLTEESTVYTFLPGETIARDLHHSELQAYSASKKKKNTDHYLLRVWYLFPV